MRIVEMRIFEHDEEASSVDRLQDWINELDGSVITVQFIQYLYRVSSDIIAGKPYAAQYMVFYTKKTSPPVVHDIDPHFGKPTFPLDVNQARKELGLPPLIDSMPTIAEQSECRFLAQQVSKSGVTKMKALANDNSFRYTRRNTSYIVTVKQETD